MNDDSLNCTVEAGKVYTVRSLALALGYKSDRPINTLFDDGLPHYSVGKRTYIAGSSFVRYIEQRETIRSKPK